MEQADVLHLSGMILRQHLLFKACRVRLDLGQRLLGRVKQTLEHH